MTKGKSWWFEKTAFNDVFIRVESENGSERLCHNQGRHRPYSSVKGSSVYEKNPKLVKIFFEVDNSRAFNPENFLWNATDLSLKLKSHVKDASAFSLMLNSLLSSLPPKEVVTVEVHQTDSSSQSIPLPDSPSLYDFNASGGEVPVIGNAGIYHSTPARPAKRSAAASDGNLPVLYKKKRTCQASESQISAEVNRAYLGSAKIRNGHLHLGTQLRELNEPFIESLVAQMKPFPGHLYQPLCVIVDSQDVSNFRENNAHAFHYKVIGGCHNLMAAKRLEEQLPEEDIFKSRMCCIYKDQLSPDAVLWLANLHNRIGEYRHTMVLKDKIQLCRNLFITSSGVDGNREKWKDTATLILGANHSKTIMNIFFKLATMKGSTCELLFRMLAIFGNGKLLKQKLKPAEIINGPVMKPFALVDLPYLPEEAANRLLNELLNQEITLSDFQKEARNLAKLQVIQKMYLGLMGLNTWAEAREQFPNESTRACLEKFIKCQLRTVPQELKNFCQSIQRGAIGHFSGNMGSSGAFVVSDGKTIHEELLISKVPHFKGADLVILDKPQDWSEADVRSCLSGVTGININCGNSDFYIAVLCAASELGMVAESVRRTRHFQEPMDAFYFLPNAAKSAVLTKCVKGLVIARSVSMSSAANLVWSGGHSQNLLEVRGDCHFKVDDRVIDVEQKPVGLYRELINAMSTPGQCVLDVCCGTGTGMVAALSEGRSVISVDIDDSMEEHIRLRVSHEVLRRPLTPEDEGDVDDENEEESEIESCNEQQEADEEEGEVGL